MTEYVEQEIRMPWPQICRMACAAMICGMTIDEFVADAMTNYLARAK